MSIAMSSAAIKDLLRRLFGGRRGGQSEIALLEPGHTIIESQRIYLDGDRPMIETTTVRVLVEPDHPAYGRRSTRMRYGAHGIANIDRLTWPADVATHVVAGAFMDSEDRLLGLIELQGPRGRLPTGPGIEYVLDPGAIMVTAS